MTRNARFSIAGLMVFVFVMALGLAALRNPSAIWAGFVPLATRALVCVAVVGAVCRNGPERAWWVGFAVCAWTFLNYFSPMYLTNGNPINVMLQTLGPMVGVKDGLLLITSQEALEFKWTSIEEDAYQTAGHCILALVATVLGGFAAPLVWELARRRVG